MGAQTDVTDDALCFQLACVVHHAALQHALPVVMTVNKVDHADVDIIGFKSGQQIVKCRADLVHFTGAYILTVAVCRADVTLNDPFVALAADGSTDIRAHLGTGHEAVEDVHAVFLTAIDNRLDLLCRMTRKPFAAKSDLADTQSCIAKLSVNHNVISVSMFFLYYTFSRRKKQVSAAISSKS